MAEPPIPVVLLVAHGSRRPETAREVEALAASLAEALDPDEARVGCGYLEINEPSIPDALRAWIQRGARRIQVLPWFLNTGRHLAEHIPALIAEVQQAHPDVAIEILPHVGGHPGMVGLLAEILRQRR